LWKELIPSYEDSGGLAFRRITPPHPYTSGLGMTSAKAKTMVSDLWTPHTHSWNMQLLTNTFDGQVVQAITSVQSVPNDRQDILRWKPSRNGICTTKEIYKHLSAQNSIQLPQQGSRSILPQANHILRRTWKSRDLPPIINAFTWRLIRRALATAERAARYSTHIDNHCSACGAVKDDAHLFFHCDLPRAVWFSFTPSIRTDNLPHENDGVQLILQSFISNSTSDALFHKILFTLWYIWKARNDNHFRRHTWTPMQVNTTVAAHIKTNTQA